MSTQSCHKAHPQRGGAPLSLSHVLALQKTRSLASVKTRKGILVSLAPIPTWHLQTQSLQLQLKPIFPMMACHSATFRRMIQQFRTWSHMLLLKLTTVLAQLKFMNKAVKICNLIWREKGGKSRPTRRWRDQLVT